MAETLAGEPTVAFLSDDLAHVSWEFRGGSSGEPGDVVVARAAVECALSEAVMLRGGGFARHVRTTMSEEGGISRADAVYTVSPTLPAGAFVIDAEAVAGTCREQGKTGV